LGLLMLRPMTIYELSMAFKSTLGLFYSASLGSLQVAVRKLRAKDFITMEEVRTGKRVRKVYTVQASGRMAFFNEMLEPIPEAKLEVTSLARLHFMGLLPAETRFRVKAIILEAIDASLSGLIAKQHELSQLRIPAEYLPIFNYQVKTLEYGIMSHTAALEWFKSLV
jgi:PadR family transcriptional regulator, regulatory protein AphA